ncbi:Hypothetical protein PHPALM_36855 [Phytophthora palmivora]|uniref:PiggyBac transposable element-derived protein domain-containing protein n=1 Tax=Phytophthora palmivora TaxID=4796 RepID=A0A2P4WYW3_9STRA|nr:Hypothetical protein PHPALM_36855 [Phytophthora palmivora]
MPWMSSIPITLWRHRGLRDYLVHWKQTSKEPFHDEDEVDDGEDALDVPSADHSDYECDVASDEEFEDDRDAFQKNDVAMRTLGDSGWKIYDEFHCEYVVVTIIYFCIDMAIGDLQLPGADDLYSGTQGVTKSAAALGKSPLGMFFYFLPKSLWLHIVTETNEYRVQCIPRDVENIRKKQLEAQAKDPRKMLQPHADIVAKLERVNPIKPYESVHVIELLTVRTLCSHTDDLDKHWATREDGAVPRGTFARYMKRDRFRTVTRYLHFSSNTASSATTDKTWKFRPVLQTIERTFRRGYGVGARVYDKDKPHKYGTKCYMTCCAETGYCSRISFCELFFIPFRIVQIILIDINSNMCYSLFDRAEVYLGAVVNKQKLKGVTQKEVIRNVAKPFEGQQGKRLIIADNFYTSCSLALTLLEMGFYYVGIHRKARLGWPRSLPLAQKSRPRGMARGIYRIAQAIQHADLVAVAWINSTPVHMIAPGCSINVTSVTQKQNMSSSLEHVPSPQLIADYHACMDGVDSYNQLRLQSYSLQQCVAFKKYY